MKASKTDKRMKKIKKRGHELVDTGKSDGIVISSKLEIEPTVTVMKGDDISAGAAKAKAYKAKKLRKSKKKDSHVSSEPSSGVNSGEESVTVSADQFSGKKNKSNKVLKRKRKDTVASGAQSAVENNEEEIKPLTQDLSDGKKVFCASYLAKNLNSLKENTLILISASLYADTSKRARKKRKKDALVSYKQNTVNNDGEKSLVDARTSSKKKKGKSKKAQIQGIDGESTITERDIVQENQEVAIADVYEISSREDDDSKGMKKWIKEYHERRPGLKVLQERIDEFITAYDEQEEQAKREREKPSWLTMAGLLLYTVREGRKQLMQKVVLLWVLWQRLQCGRKWPRKRAKMLAWISTDSRGRKPIEVRL